MTGQAIPDHKTAVLLRCAELEAHLATTKERLNLAVVQLSELADTLLTQNDTQTALGLHCEWNDGAFRQIIADVARAELELSAARKIASTLDESVVP